MFKDLFGKPRTGIHSIRVPVIDIALIDIGFTIIISVLIAKFTFTKISFEYKFVIVLLMMIFLSILFHVLFCVDTTLIRLLLY